MARFVVCLALCVVSVALTFGVVTDGAAISDKASSEADSSNQSATILDDGWSDFWEKIKGYFRDDLLKAIAVVVAVAVAIFILLALLVWSCCCCWTKWFCCCRHRCLPRCQVCLCCPCDQSRRENTDYPIETCYYCYNPREETQSILCEMLSPVRDSSTDSERVSLIRCQRCQMPDASPTFSEATDNDKAAAEARAQPKAKPVSKAEYVSGAVKKFVSEHADYCWLRELPAIGGRVSKCWILLEQGSFPHTLLLSVTPLKSDCRLDIRDDYKLRKLNELLEATNKHPYIHPILKVAYIPGLEKTDMGYVAVVQPYEVDGSLKDHIYKCDPDAEWDKKYVKQQKRPLPPKSIAVYGRQVLEVAVSLYDLSEAKRSDMGLKKRAKQACTPKAKVTGFPPQSYVTSGNILLVTGANDELHCEVGGLENSLFGYNTRLYKLVKDQGYIEHIDVLMFGHLLFEMAAGYELTTTAPTEEDFANVKHDATKEVLRHIFEHLPAIEDLRQHPYFGVYVEQTQVEVTNGMLRILELCTTPAKPH